MKKISVKSIYDAYYRTIGEAQESEREKLEFVEFLNLRLREAWRKFNWAFAMSISGVVVLDEGFIPISENSDLDDGDKFQVFAKDPRLNKSQALNLIYNGSSFFVDNSKIQKGKVEANTISNVLETGKFYNNNGVSAFAKSTSELVNLTGSIKYQELIDGDIGGVKRVVKIGDIVWENDKFYGAISENLTLPSLDAESYVELTGRIIPNAWIRYKALCPEFTYDEIFTNNTAQVANVFKSYLAEAAYACYLGARARPEDQRQAQARADSFLREEIFRQARDNSEMEY